MDTGITGITTSQKKFDLEEHFPDMPSDLKEGFLSKHSIKKPSNGQLIVTTHDTGLLDMGLRRDEIWFVDKEKSGNSKLASLAEFKVRSDLKIDKGYLNGRFGAIPLIKHAV